MANLLPLLNYMHFVGFLVFCLTLGMYPELYKMDIGGYKYYGAVFAIMYGPTLLLTPLNMLIIKNRNKYIVCRDWFWYQMDLTRRMTHYSSPIHLFDPKTIFIAGFEDILFVAPLLIFDLTSYYYIIPMGLLFTAVHTYKKKHELVMTLLLYIFVIFPTCKEYGLVTGVFYHAVWDFIVIGLSNFTLNYYQKHFDRHLRWLRKMNRIQPIRFNTHEWMKYLPKRK